MGQDLPQSSTTNRGGSLQAIVMAKDNSINSENILTPRIVTLCLQFSGLMSWKLKV